LIVHYFLDDQNKLKQVVVTKPKIKPINIALKKLRFELKKGGGLYFRNESKQHLLQYLLDELIEDDNKNVRILIKGLLSSLSCVRQVINKILGKLMSH
jgi:hypothetical protein